MILREPWYLLALAAAQRVHILDHDRNRPDRPYWRRCEEVAHRLLALDPQAPRQQVWAALLHAALDSGQTKPKHLAALRVPAGTIEILRALQAAAPNAPTHPDALAVWRAMQIEARQTA